MKTGQFSAYINTHTNTVCLVKSPNDFEYKNSSFSSLCERVPKKDALNSIQDWFEENYIPEEQRVIIN